VIYLIPIVFINVCSVIQVKNSQINTQAGVSEMKTPFQPQAEYMIIGITISIDAICVEDCQIVLF
jgi:hypothetical protein